MNLLDAINLVLPKLGERPVTSLAVKHPTLAIILPIVEQTISNSLQRGWWFNEYAYTGVPNETGEILLGSTTMSFIPDGPYDYLIRSGKLFDPRTRSYVFTTSIPGKLIERLTFDELPESAANYVFYSALVEAYATDLGVTQELQVWTNLAAHAYSDLLMEHLRHRKHSTRKSRRWQQLMYAMQG